MCWMVLPPKRITWHGIASHPSACEWIQQLSCKGANSCNYCLFNFSLCCMAVRHRSTVNAAAFLMLAMVNANPKMRVYYYYVPSFVIRYCSCSNSMWLLQSKTSLIDGCHLRAWNHMRIILILPPLSIQIFIPSANNCSFFSFTGVHCACHTNENGKTLSWIDFTYSISATVIVNNTDDIYVRVFMEEGQ